MRASLLVISATLLVCISASNRRQQLNGRIRRGSGSSNNDCSFTSVDGLTEINGYGNAGKVRFTRNVPKRRGSGTNKKWVEVSPFFLREVTPGGQAVRYAGGFGSSNTAVTWNCSVANEPIVDVNGNPSTVEVLQSEWAASRDIRLGRQNGNRLTQTVSLGFNVRLFAQNYTVDLCPRKYNASGFGAHAFWRNYSGNCSAVEVPGAGIKWSFLIENWPYQNAANHLELQIRVGLKAFFRPRSRKQSARRRRARRQAALQIVDFGDGSLENPEEVQEVCPGGTTDRPITITESTVGRSAYVNVNYVFPAPTATDCNFYYDPVMTMNTDATGAAARWMGSSLIASMIVGLVYALL